MREMCRLMDIPFEVALYESKTHIVALQRAGKLGAIIGFDSDFVTLGAENAMLDARWSLGGGRTYSAKFLDKNNPKSPYAPFVDIFGSCVFRFSSYFLHNDEGVGEKTILAACELLAAQLQPPTKPSLGALAGCVWEASTASVQARYSVDDMLRTAERAAFMFHCQECVVDGKIVRGPLPEGCGDADKIISEIPELSDSFFAEFTPEMLSKWTAGDYSVLCEDPRKPRLATQHSSAPAHAPAHSAAALT